MQPLIKPNEYPPAIRMEISRMGRIATAIANRWMLGWPGRVKKLITTRQYLPALVYQHEQEVDALAENPDNWLTETEKVQLAGLSLECPLAED